LAPLREQLARELQAELAGSLTSAHPSQNGSPAPDWSGTASIAELSQAVDRILQPVTQGDVIGAFLQAANRYSGRCALFVRRGEAFVFWRAFNLSDDAALKVRALSLPTTQPGVFKDLNARTRSSDSASTILKLAMGDCEGDKLYLFPLVVQRRMVAALYADEGSVANSVNQPALEIISRVAGLSLETAASRAAAHSGSSPSQQQAASESQSSSLASNSTSTQSSQSAATQAAARPAPQPAPRITTAKLATTDRSSISTSVPSGWAPAQASAAEASRTTQREETLAPPSAPQQAEPQAVFQSAVLDPVVSSQQQEWQSPQASSVAEPDLSSGTASAEVSGSESASDSGLASPPELESLADADREFHRKAHRFARVAVQDLLSYHHSKIEQGRQNQTLYSLLKEDIDKTRENYRLRFSATPARSFDYLHYELVAKLAGSNAAALGEQYPGPSED
jgi:hypothetical protein